MACLLGATISALFTSWVGVSGIHCAGYRRRKLMCCRPCIVHVLPTLHTRWSRLGCAVTVGQMSRLVGPTSLARTRVSTSAAFGGFARHAQGFASRDATVYHPGVVLRGMSSDPPEGHRPEDLRVSDDVVFVVYSQGSIGSMRDKIVKVFPLHALRSRLCLGLCACMRSLSRIIHEAALACVARERADEYRAQAEDHGQGVRFGDAR